LLLEVWERGPLQQTYTYTSCKLVNGVVLEVCEGDRKSIRDGEMNFVGSFSCILGQTMRIHMLTCEKCHGWPEGIDDEVLHVG
jgi:hypothetical protein